MYNAPMYIMMNTHPLVIIGALLPLMTALILWRVFFLNFHESWLKPLTGILGAAAEAAKTEEGCSLDNTGLFEESFGENAPGEFLRAWEKVKRDLKSASTGGLISEASVYFSFDSLLRTSGGRDHLPGIWRGAGITGLLSLLLPLTIASLIFPASTGGAVIFGLLSLSLILICQGILALLDYRGYQKAAAAYKEFTCQFDRILPVASAFDGPALLIEATNKSREAFAASAERIEKAFGTFHEESVLPALQQSSREMVGTVIEPALAGINAALAKAMEAFSERQENEMKAMAEAFVLKLTDEMENRMTALGSSIEEVEGRIRDLNGELRENIRGTGEMMGQQLSLLTQAARLLNKTVETEEAFKGLHMSIHGEIESLSAVTAKMEENSEKFIDGALATFAETKTLQENLSSLLAESMGQMAEEQTLNHESLIRGMEKLNSQYDKWNGTIDGMMENITNKMNEAVVSAGIEMGKGFNQITSENAISIKELTELSTALREEYEKYFSRVESSTRDNLTDMDYHMQNVIGKIREEMEEAFKDILGENRDVLFQYKNSTTDLLQSFEEQSRSMNLYAKEITFDIDRLAESLKDSVKDFSAGMQESVDQTMNSFDEGLAGLSERIANTVEGIADAVDNLPKALGRNS
ncbi:hypothetical protein MASR2M70_15770 [Bacillota bacterium]